MRTDLPVIAEYIKRIKVNVDESDILHRLKDRWRWPEKLPWGVPSIDVINEDHSKTPAIYEEDGYINTSKCINLYNEGKTLILTASQWLFKDISVISEILDKAHGYHCNINLYFGKAASFEMHTHDYAVLVKNIYGSSDWVINNQDVILNNQDVIFFDKHTPHQVIKVSEPKLSMTCNLG